MATKTKTIEATRLEAREWGERLASLPLALDVENKPTLSYGHGHNLIVAGIMNAVGGWAMERGGSLAPRLYLADGVRVSCDYYGAITVSWEGSKRGSTIRIEPRVEDVIESIMKSDLAATQRLDAITGALSKAARRVSQRMRYWARQVEDKRARTKAEREQRNALRQRCEAMLEKLPSGSSLSSWGSHIDLPGGGDLMPRDDGSWSYAGMIGLMFGEHYGKPALVRLKDDNEAVRFLDKYTGN